MFNNRNVIEKMRAQPFQAFDIRTSDGRAYTVEHPEFLAAHPKANFVVFVTDDFRTITIATAQIVSLETTNGPRPTRRRSA